MKLCKIVACAFMVAMLLGLAGENYPNQAIKLIIYVTQGGSSDASARLLAGFASKELGVPIMVENNAGAGGRVAFTSVYSAKSDGYTLGTTNLPTMELGEVLFNPAYKSKEFTFIYGFVQTGHVLAVKQDSPIKTFQDLVDRAKKGRINCGTFGKGSSGHIQTVALVNALGIGQNVGYVHFGGSAPMTTALLGGNVDFCTIGVGGFTKTADLRGLLNFAPSRMPDSKLKDIQVPSEAGLSKMPIVDQVFAFIGPPGMPKKMVDKWVAVLDAAAQDQTVIDGFKKLGFEVAKLKPAELSKLDQQDTELAKKFVDLLK